MCGIAGLFRPSGLAAGDFDAVRRMTGAVAHRGPDGEGFWTDDAVGVALGHRRLSILDLSSAGAQPMHSASGRYTITFNGEIYNFTDLRARVVERQPGIAWRGHSDTEILLAAIELFGVDEALRLSTGMFAFGLFDRAERRLTLARDRFGEKPLHFALIDGALIFASELKSFKAHPKWSGTIDRQALTAFVRNGYVPAPMTIYAEARKLLPGEILEFDAAAIAARAPTRRRFWDPLVEAQEARRARFAGSPAEAEAELDRLIHAAVQRQIVADVPVGSFLSGGIDSSTITAIMQAQRSTPIETFSLGFVEEKFNEAPFAQDVARHLGTNHHEIILSGHEAQDLVTTMPSIYDEPFADPSQLPTTMLARFARSTVVVALSGDGGDELFAGYGRHHSIRRKWAGGWSSAIERRASAAYAQVQLAMAVRPAEAFGFSHFAGRAVAPWRVQLEDFEAKFSAANAVEGYERGFVTVNSAHDFVRGGVPASDPLIQQVADQSGTVLDKVTLFDANRYLPDDILVKVDRAAMASGLETRVPLLDHDIARFAWSLPDDVRLHGGQHKGILKAVLGRYVPRALWDRPKRGFGIPVADWLRGPFRALASDLFARDVLVRGGLLEPERVTAIWQDFLNGGQRRTNLVWALFVAQLYLSRKN